ncbi:MAG: VCBS repeat-containing protein, partial [Planctomycetes bacterium]|nr:VCBS repeat-containing protein [Planctomycetota bacterium]
MKRETTIWLAVIGLVALASVAVLTVQYFQGAPSAPVTAVRGDGQSASPRPAPSGNESAPETDSSIAPVLGQAPEFTLTDQDGQSFGASDLQGKVWIANFIFTRCRATCPMQTQQMAALQAALAKDPSWPGVRLLSISVDPEYDRPDILKAYATLAGAEHSQWKFLTGDREKIWRTAKEGFHLPVADDARNSAMPIMHDSKFVLVDRQGRIRGYFDVLEEGGLAELQRALDFVLPEMAPPEEGVAASAREMTHLAQPPEILHNPWLEERRQAQTQALQELEAFHDFQFRNAVEETGTEFHPQIVDEQRWRLQVNHYDHGNGVAVADVDSDGRLDIFFVAQAGANGLFRNRGDGKFENITEQAGVAVEDRIGVTASFADIDNDGDADLFVTTVRGGNLMFENDGSGVFRDIAAEAGLDYVGHSSAGVFFDYNRDGLLDLFLTNVGKYTTEELAGLRIDGTSSLPEGDYRYYVGTADAFAGHLKPDFAERSILYKNLDGRSFADVSSEVGLSDASWSGDATPIDPNEDGWPDLYVLDMQGHDEYYENVGGERFDKKSREVFPKTPWGSMGVKSLDFDNDGHFDLFITDMHSDMSEDVGPEREKLKSEMQWPESFLGSDPEDSIFGNAFFRHRGGDSGSELFEEISDEIGVENYWPWGLSAADFNADGFEDLFIASSMCFPYRYGANSLLLNDGGRRFVDSEFALGVEPRPEGKRIKPWFELDCDGQDRDNPICRGRTGKVTVWSALGSRSSVVFDLDDDGDLDIVTNDFNSEPLVLLSNLAEKRSPLNYLAVRLRGAESNRDGLGAVVTVTTAEGVYKKANDGKSGYLSQSRMPLYFGLGEAAAAQRVEVAWPSGAT